MSVNDKMEDLLGEIAEEKERANNVTSELESCRSLLKQTVEDFEHAKVRMCVQSLWVNESLKCPALCRPITRG